MLPTPSPVAYAGFLKGGAGNLKIMKTKATTQNQFGFWPKIRKFGEDKKNEKGLYSNLVRFLAQN